MVNGGHRQHGFWKGKKVFLTGHTGFKGSWATLLLQRLGAEISGYSLQPEPGPQLFRIADVNEGIQSYYGDITDYNGLFTAMNEVQPEIVLHLAAQPLVRLSYDEPIHTFNTNIMGTVYLLEAARQVSSVKVVVNVTSDKCYDNPGHVVHAFQEGSPMGGADPYSASKGGAELVAAAYSKSYYTHGEKVLASARAGNVIGGGDFAKDRIVPDIIRSLESHQPLTIRNPNAVRPWQHVLDCIHGYLNLAEHLWHYGHDFDGGWNFGPDETAILSVSDIVEQALHYMSVKPEVVYETRAQPYEAKCLMLNSDKARQQLGWKPKLTAQEAIQWSMEWYNDYLLQQDMRQVTLQQINRYMDK
ncbi:CDP-glucose 4,6-dehydratase [Paenibacillus kobensis]|uniref:CDP-glucose 4,6-dehydratase n=1 Tax=Paenibacillus kobensis TaxID=59841 RepID=UPI000FD8CFBC|nr:CDP-glucose 4,6-dehydratase [Paenibacillus kobensis]